MKKEIKDELSEIAPWLTKAEKPGLPLVPAQYFEGFEARMIRRIANETDSVDNTTSEPNSIFRQIWRFFTKPAFAVSLASAIVLILSIWYFTYQPPADVYAAQLAQIDQQELLSYIENNIDQYDMEAILGDNTANLEDFDFTELGEFPDSL